MNKDRRNKIIDIQERLGEIKGELDELRNAEQEAFDNMPDGIQGGDQGQTIEGNVEIMDNIIDALEQMDDEASSLIDA